MLFQFFPLSLHFHFARPFFLHFPFCLAALAYYWNIKCSIVLWSSYGLIGETDTPERL
jgi:hypothetical protein